MQTKRTFPWLSLGNPVMALLVLAGFLAFAIYVGHVLTVRNVDFFQFVDMAQGLETEASRAGSAGCTVGYPLLIRIGLDLGFDAVTIGHGLSVLGGVCLLLGLSGWPTA